MSAALAPERLAGADPPSVASAADNAAGLIVIGLAPPLATVTEAGVLPLAGVYVTVAVSAATRYCGLSVSVPVFGSTVAGSVRQLKFAS